MEHPLLKQWHENEEQHSLKKKNSQGNNHTIGLGAVQVSKTGTSVLA